MYGKFDLAQVRRRSPRRNSDENPRHWGAGFIGSHVVDHYIDAGHEVLVLDNLSSGRKENVHPKAELVVVDLCDHAGVADVLGQFCPHLINHHAAQIDLCRSVAEPVFEANVNVIESVNLLQNSARTGVQGMLYASTGGAMYCEVQEPATEQAEKRPFCLDTGMSMAHAKTRRVKRVWW